MLKVRDLVGRLHNVPKMAPEATVRELGKHLGWQGELSYLGQPLDTERRLDSFRGEAPLVMSTHLGGGSLGLCVGGLLSLGSCGHTTSSQSTNIVNTAIARAYYSSMFSCKSSVDAGNSVKTGGVCSCTEVGIYLDAACLKYQAGLAQLQAQECAAVTAADAGKPGDVGAMVCICGKAPGAGCSVNIDQSSTVGSQSICNNTNDVEAKLKDNFGNDVTALIKQTMSDIGGLFDSNDQKSVTDLANQIQQSITQKNVSEISSVVTSTNKVTSGCGGINFGITQYSYFQNILSVLNENKSVQDLSAQVSNHVATVIARKDNGFLGWLSSTTGIIVMVILGIVGLVVCVMLYKYFTKKQAAGA